MATSSSNISELIHIIDNIGDSFRVHNSIKIIKFTSNNIDSNQFNYLCESLYNTSIEELYLCIYIIKKLDDNNIVNLDTIKIGRAHV